MGEFADMAIEQGMDEWYEDRNEPGNYQSSGINHLYHHVQCNDIKIEATTEKAYLIKFKDDKKCWVAKKLCKELKDTSVYIWEGATLVPIKKTK